MKISSAVIALLLCVSIANAQSKMMGSSTNMAKEAFLQMNELDVARYNKLYLTIEQNGLFSIVTACIPAHVIHISWKDSAGNYETAMKKFNTLAKECDLFKIQNMSQWTVKEFEDACLDARNSGGVK